MNSSFNGERLKEARLFNKLSITELAEKLNVTKQMISKYENGKSIPSTEKSLLLNGILNYPREFFYTKENFNYESKGTFFRSRLTATRKSKIPAEYLLKYSIVVRDFLDEYIEFPQLIEVDKFSDENDIEQITLKLREIMNLHDDPIEDMIEVVELMGIIAVKFGYDEEKVDAFSALTELNNKSYFTIVTGNSRSFFRQQFSLAHEIGHWVLHQDYIPEELDKEEYKVMEQEANAFAASFLMPSQSFSEDFKSINLNLPNLLNLKRKWNVSIAAIIERAHQLNLLSIDKKSQLYRKMNYHKWRNPEPLDSDTPVTEPLALSQAIELLIDENILTGYEIKKNIMEKYNLYISQKMLAEVCNTSESIFNHRNKLELNIKMKKFTKNIDEYN
ncbi:XRE family transcriptional regulator [Mammaliicoccus sciuri]|uniref:XRE family transcriptional regulator n=1 Tax=Mammaliicoccus sciuri TaxID=1296 RepID=UPI001E4F4EC9|nr:XRE family transcriptional regulator [Mammaliicoccus sciuri]MCD3219733.1 XRE family transcriptional regulator [Mammaliicoccus sciuri]MCJ0924963.1 XRE family transcriptional regulator [Mammaliicoccus sciuri]MCJ1763005.1 XRE family transcriptional regulator [Mammaliicoccus sciuri]UXU70288.1 XRE family transcriptional regulator [Mammaliicoccus sciuri]